MDSHFATVGELFYRSTFDKLMEELDNFKIVFSGNSFIDTVESLGVSFRQSRWDEPKDVLA
jgi:hypothetical protein